MAEANARKARGGRGLAGKQRLPKEFAYLSRLAAESRKALEDELIQAVGGRDKLRAIHFEVLDTAYWCDAGVLMAAAFLENKPSWVDNESGDFHPVVASVLRLKAMKMQALKAVGLDKPGPKAAGDWWDAFYAQQQQRLPTTPTNGEQRQPTSEEAGETKPT